MLSLNISLKKAVYYLATKYALQRLSIFKETKKEDKFFIFDMMSNRKCTVILILITILHTFLLIWN